jgi:hypothetical protein
MKGLLGRRTKQSISIDSIKRLFYFRTKVKQGLSNRVGFTSHMLSYTLHCSFLTQIFFLCSFGSLLLLRSCVLFAICFGSGNNLWFDDIGAKKRSDSSSSDEEDPFKRCEL